MLHDRGWVKDEAGHLVLTAPGAAAAHDLVARRDEWSAWLEHGWKLRLPDAREPDPRDVRGSLGSEAADRLAALRAEAAA